jgi:hypothetical protein
LLSGHWAPILAVFVVAVVVNWPALDDYFHGDDYLAFIDLTTKPTWKHLEEVITFKDANVYWRPLGEVYYLVIWGVFGLNEVAFHAANLALFLATLALLYAFCLQAGFGRYVALGACAFLTLFPNHVVSIAWVTNGPRLLAVMFVLAALVLLQMALSRGQARMRPAWHFEVASFVAFALAGFADEVALALAPLPIVYSLMFDRERPGGLRRSIFRAVPYAALALTLVPLQFLASDTNQQLSGVRFGWHMPEHFWALTSKLVLPVPEGITFADISAEQWTAGGVAIGAIGLALVFGSQQLRFLALWLAIGLAPFTTWTLPIAPARYLYMAAVPFAIVAAWLVIMAIDWLRRTAPAVRLAPNLAASMAVTGVSVLALAFLGGAGASITQERDEAWGRDTEPYRILADGLKAAAPQVPKGGRVIIYYGIWNTYHVWPDAVAKTIYKDPTVSVLNVPRALVESAGPTRSAKDVVLFYTGRGFIRSAPIVSPPASTIQP